jgi:hypothetical protein
MYLKIIRLKLMSICNHMLKVKSCRHYQTTNLERGCKIVSIMLTLLIYSLVLLMLMMFISCKRN